MHPSNHPPTHSPIQPSAHPLTHPTIHRPAHPSYHPHSRLHTHKTNPHQPTHPLTHSPANRTVFDNRRGVSPRVSRRFETRHNRAARLSCNLSGAPRAAASPRTAHPRYRATPRGVAPLACRAASHSRDVCIVCAAAPKSARPPRTAPRVFRAHYRASSAHSSARLPRIVPRRSRTPAALHPLPVARKDHRARVLIIRIGADLIAVIKGGGDASRGRRAAKHRIASRRIVSLRIASHIVAATRRHAVSPEGYCRAKEVRRGWS